MKKHYTWRLSQAVNWEEPQIKCMDCLLWEHDQCDSGPDIFAVVQSVTHQKIIVKQYKVVFKMSDFIW